MRRTYLGRQIRRNRSNRSSQRWTGNRNDLRQALDPSILPQGMRSGNHGADRYSESMVNMAFAAHRFATAAAKTGRGDLAWWSSKIEEAHGLIWEMQLRLESYQRGPSGADEGEASHDR